MPSRSTTGSSTSARVLVWAPNPVASASSANAMIAADSTVRNTLARLIASFQISDRVASRLQCSVARICAADGPNGCSLAAAASSRPGSGVLETGAAFLVLSVSIADLREVTELPGFRRSSWLLAVGADVVGEVEDVVGVVAVLQCGQPGQLVGAVGALDAGLPLVGEVVDIDAAGERLHRGAVAPRGRHPRRVLGRVGPVGHGHELHQRVPVAEGGLLVAHVGDRAAVALQTAIGQRRRIAATVAIAAGQEG